MKNLTGLILALAMAAPGYLRAEDEPVGSEDKPRELYLLQDDAQQPMVSKVYSLKYVSAGDLTPFILGCVKRYNINSSVERLKYSAGNQQFLLVTTPPDMMKRIDAIVALADRPGKIDADGSLISGTGMYRFTYQPKFRSSDDMVTIANTVIRADGYAFRDATSNLLYWKETKSIGESIGQWFAALDHPLPQAELIFKVYEIRQSDLNDIGVDYLAWKNGPGLNMLSVGWDTMSFNSTEKVLSNIDTVSSWSYGGLFVAPQFDMSFVRMLAQKGKAKIAATGVLTVINNYTGSYFVKFSPESQNLLKDTNDKTSVVIGSSVPLQVKLTAPVICFRRQGEIDTAYAGDGFNYTTYSRLGGSIQFSYQITSGDVIERNNRGVELTDQSVISSALTSDIGVERLLAVYNRKQQAEQVVGVPFLVNVPWLKYLFSTTTKVDENVQMFVTVSSRLEHPENTLTRWSGQVVEAKNFCKEMQPKE